MFICCLTFSVINKRKKQHKSELVHTINPHLDDWQRSDITLFYLSTVALEIFSSWSLLTKLPVIHSLPVSCVSKCTDKESKSPLWENSSIIGSSPLSICPTASLWGMAEWVFETMCPWSLGFSQDGDLGHTECRLVNKGATHHRFTQNIIW